MMKNAFSLNALFAMTLVGGCAADGPEDYANVGQFIADYCDATCSALDACAVAHGDSCVASCLAITSDAPALTFTFPHRGVTSLDAWNCVEAAAAQTCDSIALDEEPAGCTGPLSIFETSEQMRGAVETTDTFGRPRDVSRPLSWLGDDDLDALTNSREISAINRPTSWRGDDDLTAVIESRGINRRLRSAVNQTAHAAGELGR